MASGDQLVIRAIPVGPLSGGYETSLAQSIAVTSAVATFNGASAAGDFIPALAFYDSSGTLLTRAVASTAITAGTSAEVSFYPFVQAASSGGGSAALEVTDGVHTVTAVTEIDFTSGATVSSGGAGIADVAISGGGGYTPGTQVGVYSAPFQSCAPTVAVNASFVHSSGAALLDLSNPILPTILTAGVYSVHVTFQADSVFTVGSGIFAPLAMNGPVPTNMYGAATANLSPTIGPLGEVSNTNYMRVGDALQTWVVNNDTGARFIEWPTIVVVLIAVP